MEAAITPNMVMLKEQFGFDTIAARRRAVELAGLPSAANVLDVGTGSGWMAFVLAEAGYEVTSVDLDAATLRRAAERTRELGRDIADRIRFVHADALALPFRDDAFEAVFSFDTMHHLPDCHRAIAEMMRVARPGGTVVVADLSTQGLAAVRYAMACDGELHEENSCRADLVGRIMAEFPGRFVRDDGMFVTTFVLAHSAENDVVDMDAPHEAPAGTTAIPLELCEVNPIKACSVQRHDRNVEPFHPSAGYPLLDGG
jgi:SAM-dependent methyltransferase